MTFEDFDNLSQDEKDYVLYNDAVLDARYKFDELMDINYNFCLDDFEILKSMIIEVHQCGNRIK